MIIKALQLLLSLSILVFIHELGHFLLSKLFKIRVEKFYMFFNPSFSLVRMKKINGRWKFKFFAKNLQPLSTPIFDHKGNHIQDENGKYLYNTIDVEILPDDDWRKYPDNTEFGIGWIPLGGYCKIAGMVDESMDQAQLATAPKSYEYRAVSVWKRLPIITAGVAFNFILALIIYSATLFTWGEEYVPIKNFKAGFDFGKVAHEAGFQDGDRLVAADGNSLEEMGIYSEISKQINDNTFRTILNAKKITVLRKNKLVEITIPTDFSQKIIAQKSFVLFPRLPFVVDSVITGSIAQKSGVQKGDSLVSVNDTAKYSFPDFVEILQKHKSDSVKIGFYRQGIAQSMVVKLDTAGKMGVYPRDFAELFGSKKVSYGFSESFPKGISLGITKLKGYVSDLKFLFQPQGFKNLGGFKSIGSMFDAQWNWLSFWEMTALLSIILAFMNILPIPALDGGHLLFLLVEIVTGRKPSDKFLQRAQLFGMILLLALMIFANANDFLR